jgi:hypothetical protein
VHSRQFLPHGRDDIQSLVHLRQARLALALHGERPAAPACAQSHPEGQPLCRRQGQQGVSLGLGPSLLTPLHSLRRIAQAPQGAFDPQGLVALFCLSILMHQLGEGVREATIRRGFITLVNTHASQKAA